MSGAADLLSSSLEKILSVGHSKKVLSGVGALVGLSLLYTVMFIKDDASESRMLSQQWRTLVSNLVPQGSNTSAPAPLPWHNYSGYKKILFWNDFFGSKDYYFGSGHEAFLRAGCRVHTCVTTADRDLFLHNEVDAVIWHCRSDDHSLPAIRSPHTRYVFALWESPRNQHQDLRRYLGVFNYTMTYRRDSDVYAPYGRFRPLSAERRSAISGGVVNYAAGKTKMAVWFVSNCHSSSGREALVSQLQRHVTVDVYGLCGSLSCPRDQDERCQSMLDTDYRFYLAFENSLCRDYITEKFFKMTERNIVPVVYGMGPYDKVAPKHSYINVFDFPSVKALADHLTYLAANDTAYNEYFRWRHDYESEGTSAKAWCDLCEKLHTDHKEKTYDIYKWWEEDKCVDSDNVALKTYLTSSKANT